MKIALLTIAVLLALLGGRCTAHATPPVTDAAVSLDAQDEPESETLIGRDYSLGGHVSPLDPLWFVAAFLLGFGVRQVGLPPLLGFLAAGFALNALGVEGGPTLDYLADVGVNLLLFSIGLKLKVKSLLRPEVWGVASIHMVAVTIGFTALVFLLALAGLGLFADLDLGRSVLIAFALSFSSTVFAVKVLEEKGEMSSRHGRTSIGILVMQDVFAIVFLTLSTGKMPSPWTLLLIALVPVIRPLLLRLMTRCGHGELLMLFGVLLLFGVTNVFNLLNLKPDLGALLAGVIVGSHPKASELSGHLLSFKDLLLTAFFLNIGFAGAPSWEGIGIAALFVVLMPLKVALFFALLTRFRLRGRTSLITSLSLANYSEFGLIVGAVGLSKGWISGDWLVIVAVALTMSFIVAAPLNSAAETIYRRLAGALARWQSDTRLPDDQPVDPGDAEIVIFGMGRMGTAAYAAMHERHGDVVMGIDANADKVLVHQSAGRNVETGDATDSDFWDRVMMRSKTRLIVLAMSNHTENLAIARQLREFGFDGVIAATARYDDEVEALRSAGVNAAYNIYTEAGAGFADHVLDQFPND